MLSAALIRNIKNEKLATITMVLLFYYLVLSICGLVYEKKDTLFSLFLPSSVHFFIFEHVSLLINHGGTKSIFYVN